MNFEVNDVTANILKDFQEANIKTIRVIKKELTEQALDASKSDFSIEQLNNIQQALENIKDRVV